MQPEISHRCPSCGASVRVADALFCPECGVPLASKAEKSQAAEPAEVSDAPAEVEVSQPSQNAEDVPIESAPDASSAKTEPAATSLNTESASAESNPDVTPPKDSSQTEVTAPAPTAARRGDKTRERLHRASEVARGVTRGVIEEPAKRVEKIRHVSNVVIEEASYDPSLRFVLVALGLFVIFVILLVLSKVMG